MTAQEKADANTVLGPIITIRFSFACLRRHLAAIAPDVHGGVRRETVMEKTSTASSTTIAMKSGPTGR